MVRSAAVFASHRFAVRQDRVGLKVGIDGIVLAAAAARAAFPAPAPEWSSASAAGADGDDVVRVLDVGCGCGIIALLLRQAASFADQPAHVTALDIDAAAAEQARENVAQSPWPSDFEVRHSSLQDFVMSDGARAFEVVVSNPPYFPRPPPRVQLHSASNRANQLKSHGRMEATGEELWPQTRAHARFREYLPPLDLLRGAAALLAPNGSFWCVYPASEEKLLLRAAQVAGLRQRNRLGVKFKAGLPVPTPTTIFRLSACLSACLCVTIHCLKQVARVVWSFGLGSPPMVEGLPATANEVMASPLVDEVLAVRHDDRTYTKEFEQLTQMCYAHDLPTAR